MSEHDNQYLDRIDREEWNDVEAALRIELATAAARIRELEAENAALEAVKREARKAERQAIIKWLSDCADDFADMSKLEKLFRHEIEGVRKGLHLIEKGPDA